MQPLGSYDIPYFKLSPNITISMLSSIHVHIDKSHPDYQDYIIQIKPIHPSNRFHVENSDIPFLIVTKSGCGYVEGTRQQE